MEKPKMSHPEEYPIESDIIETDEGEFYDVIGIDHPVDRVVAYIRYYPITHERQNTESVRTVIRNFSQNLSQNFPPSLYGKLYDLGDRNDWIKNNHPEYLIRPSNYDFSLQTVPFNKIKSHLKPNLRLMELNNSLSQYESQLELHALFQDAVDFCNKLSKDSGVPLQNIGITGSLLSGLVTADSDLDIVVYGFLNSLKIRDVIRSIFQINASDSEIRRYTKDEMKKLYIHRTNGTPLTFYEFLKYEFRKLHQGKFRGRDFFIRFLEYNTREEYANNNHFDRQQIRILGRAKIAGQVRGDEFWWTTPARLEISNIQYIETQLNSTAEIFLSQYHLNLKQLSRTYSIRGRIIENARLLEGIIAEGTLEIVIPVKEPAYLQLTLGADPRDYLKQA